MTLPLKDYGRYKADLAAFEAYAYDSQALDGVNRGVFGIRDRASGIEVVSGTHSPMSHQGDGRVPFVVWLTGRADDVPIEQVAELIRSSFVHYFLGHCYCDRIGEIVVHDTVTAASCTIPHDDCMASVVVVR